MNTSPLVKHSILALSIAAFSAPAVVLGDMSSGGLNGVNFNQERQERLDRSRETVEQETGSPAGHTGGATSTTTMEPDDGMGASTGTGTTGAGTGTSETMGTGGTSGTGTPGTTGNMGTTGDMGTGTGTSGAGNTTGTSGTRTTDGMGTSTGTGTYGTGTGAATPQDRAFETDRNQRGTAVDDDTRSETWDNRNTTPEGGIGTDTPTGTTR